MACSTVRTAVDDVSKTFRDFDKPDPRKDRDGLTSRLLQMQYQGYKNVDPGTKQQKALSLSVIRKLKSIASQIKFLFICKTGGRK